MKDFLGNELEIGDNVVFIGAESNARLYVAKVIGFGTMGVVKIKFNDKRKSTSGNKGYYIGYNKGCRSRHKDRLVKLQGGQAIAKDI